MITRFSQCKITLFGTCFDGNLIGTLVGLVQQGQLYNFSLSPKSQLLLALTAISGQGEVKSFTT